MVREIKRHEKQQEDFVEAFIRLIAQAIDDKSPYTAGHCNRVPEIDIMHKMALDEHLDMDLFLLFLKSGVYLEYAKKFMPEEQIDQVDIGKYLT